MSQTGVVSWSQTAASNATADSNINFAEGMAPSQVNDSARAMMASVAKWRDDNTGANAVGGGPVTYTYSSAQVFSSLSVLNGQTLTLFFSFGNSANPTLNIDSLGAKPITFDDSTAIPAGFIAANSTHRLTYDNSVGKFYIHSASIAGFLPPGVIMPYAGSAAPTGWLLCDGSAVSRTTFANLFAAISTAFGIGDGSTTFNVPNTADKVLAGKGSGSILSFSGTVGSTGGAASTALTTGMLPQITPAGTIGGSQTFSNVLTSAGGQNVGSAAAPAVNVPGSITVNGSNFSFSGTPFGSVSPTAVPTVQPTLIVNHIIKT